jgi:transposase
VVSEFKHIENSSASYVPNSKAIYQEWQLGFLGPASNSSNSVPPGYQRQLPIRRPKLGPWLGVIDAILKEDKTRPVKQRHTAKRIFERLKAEHKFSGGYTIVKDYVRGEELRGREMFVPLVHPAGEAQTDFGEALVVITGVEQKAHFLAMDMPHSDDCFVMAFPAETTEAFLEGHARAFEYFGAVPTRR